MSASNYFNTKRCDIDIAKIKRCSFFSRFLTHSAHHSCRNMFTSAFNTCNWQQQNYPNRVIHI